MSLSLPLIATRRGLFTAERATTRQRSPLRDASHSSTPLSSLPAPQTNYNSRPPPCQTLPLAPIPSNENLVTVSPGFGFPNKQTNRPGTLPALLPCTAQDSCGGSASSRHLAPPPANRALAPSRPALPRLSNFSLQTPPTTPVPPWTPREDLRGERAPPPPVGPPEAQRPEDSPRGSRRDRRWPRLSGPLPPPSHTSAGGRSRPSTVLVAGATAAAA